MNVHIVRTTALLCFGASALGLPGGVEGLFVGDVGGEARLVLLFLFFADIFEDVISMVRE